MGEFLSRLVGAASAGVLILLPGAWIVATARLQGLAIWMRLATACVLSPLVLYAQFYALRWCGASFETSAHALVVLNLPAAVLLWWRVRAPAPADLVTWWRAWPFLAVGLVLLVAPAIWKHAEFPYWMHSWQHSGTIYLLANGELVPEEARLAGIAQGYPWAAHLFQGLIARVLDLPPAITYLATNVLWVLIITCFVGAHAASLGATVRGRALSWIALWFAVNIVGFALRQWVFGWRWELEHAYKKSLFGDPRFTPWLWKFQFMEHIVFGLGAFAALPTFVARAWRAERSLGDLAVVTALLACVGFVYPVLCPAGFALVGGCAAVAFARRRWNGEYVPVARAVELALTVVLAGAASYGHLKLLTSQRAYGTGGPSSPSDVVSKCAQAAISTLPLLVALAVYAFRARRAAPRMAAILAVGALASLGLYACLHIPSPSTEYKFMFAAAVMLAPFAGAAAEPLLARAGRAWPLVVSLCLLLGSLPYLQRQTTGFDWTAGAPLPVELSHFELRFAREVRGASVFDAIRETSPPDAVVAVDAPFYDVTALTWRPLYAPENHHEAVPGVYIDLVYMLTQVRGYHRELVRRRTDTREALYRGDDDQRSRALDEIDLLARPIVVLCDERERGHAELLAWLARAGRGRELARDDGLIAWLVDVRSP